MKINRDEDGIAHIVALSGGKDSTCLALALAEKEPRQYNFVCTPTGNELDTMFDHWRKLAKMLGAPLIPIMGGTLKSVIEDQHAIPNHRMRFCTRLLKIEPYGRFIQSALPAVSYVGLRADEDRDGITHGGDFLPTTETRLKQRYPLQEWGWGMTEVQSFLAKRQIEIPERTDCAWCFFQRLGEWYNLWKDYPKSYAEAIAIEKKYGHTFRSKDRDAWPAALEDLAAEFASGHIPERSLKMMESRKGMCRACSL